MCCVEYWAALIRRGRWRIGDDRVEGSGDSGQGEGQILIHEYIVTTISDKLMASGVE